MHNSIWLVAEWQAENIKSKHYTFKGYICRDRLACSRKKMQMVIFVGNLNRMTTGKHLTDLFAPFGAITKSRLMLDEITKRSRGFGYIEMPDAGFAQNAIGMLNNSIYMGEKISVYEASPKQVKAIVWK